MDSTQFNVKILSLSDKLFRLAKSMLRNTEAAQDAVQDLSMKLLISRNRLQGYKTALEQRGITLDDTLIISGETPEETEQETMKLLNMENPPDSIFAISDLTMTGVMKAIFRKNLKVPDDISVIGFCEEPFRSMYHPPLSAIEPMGFEIGKKATELLFERLDGYVTINSEPRVIYLDGTLIKGGSISSSTY